MSKAYVQKQAPQFTTTAVVDGEIKEGVSLKDYEGKWTVLVFFPLAWTFVCPTEVVAFSDAVEQFRQRGAEVLFCSVDSEYTLLSWANAPRRDGGLGAVNWPLLSDKTHKIAKDYGVLIEEDGVALRGLFIIDPTQKLRQITINDLPVGRSVDETLRLIDAFKFTDEFGEVCPANWQKGDATMTAKPKESLAYFQKVHSS